ncbi:uncharacterized protein HMPREF1541_10897 [Cyphellophora europaea CBS 101466]|uniref:Enoyl reductase (ER) domain-containing protein n=1 Tax=Cyphellophora europaea (strain CBS 101466) TaxID=1220924 RepID=W2S5R4_CYPE1|nr:uncharacterized protein HMPREF1541_10897 [Cyphellophora europaea CBS 101466]ETN44032.1 hypothetical protein HMPREF1541_10897 [Cyphellophora europaea CBS 101466]
MKQWVTDLSGLAGLRQEAIPVPEPQEDEVLVKISAVSVNFRDVEVCIGDYDHYASISPPSSIVPCSDMVGTIVKFGNRGSDATASEWVEGDRVMAIFNLTHMTGQITDEHSPSGLGLPLPGVLSEYRCFPIYGLVKVPSYLSDEEGSTLPIAVVTAWMALNWMRPIGQPVQGADKIVLLQGTGGVSIAGLQLAKASGLTAIVTSSSDEKLNRAKELGADYVINYRATPEWQDEVLHITEGKGVDIIFEQGGPQTLAKSFTCVKWGGMISSIGYLSGKQDNAESRINTNVLALRRNVTLKGICVGPKDRLEEALELYQQKIIHPIVDKVLPFDQAKEALEYVAAGSHFGKVVVSVV